MAPRELKETHSTDTAAAPQPVSSTAPPSGETSNALAQTPAGSPFNTSTLPTEVPTTVGVQLIPQLAPLLVPPVIESSPPISLQSVPAPPQLGSDSSAPSHPHVKPDDDLDDTDNLDTDELPDDLMETSTETLSDLQAAFKPSAQHTTGSTASPAVPEQAPGTASSSSRITSAVVSREASTYFRGYIGFPAFEELDEEEQRHYQQRLYRDRLSVLLHSAAALMERHCVQLDQLVSDIETIGFSVRKAPATELKLASRARILGEMEIKQWLRVSSKPGQEVAMFCIEDLWRLVSDGIRHRIPSLGPNFSANMRFEEMRKYSSVHVHDPKGILYVPSPASAVQPELPPSDP